MLRSLLLILAAILLALLTTLSIAWLLPLAAIHASGTRWNLGHWAIDPPRGIIAPESDLWWADSRPEWPVPRAGHYLIHHHPLLTTIDMRRIIFMGSLEEKPYFRQNPPPPWAGTISTDMREGFEQVITTATGWPLRCFKGELWINWRAAGNPPPPAAPVAVPGLPAFRVAPSNPPAEVSRGLWTVTNRGTTRSAIPYQPIWPALIANTAIVSAGWFGILLLPGIARRAFRRHRGRCHRCNYDLRATPPDSPCPECGTPR